MAPRTQQLNHAAIGNGRVLALVAPNSAIEWFCLPRIDSPSVFGSLLDDERGGSFSITGENRDGKLEYVANTNVARTLFEDASGSWELLDFAPRTMVGDGSVFAPAEIVRLVLPRSGTPRLRVHFDPRPDYGSNVVRHELSALGIVAIGGPRPIHLLTNASARAIIAGDVIAFRNPCSSWSRWRTNRDSDRSPRFWTTSITPCGVGGCGRWDARSRLSARTRCCARPSASSCT